MLRGPGTRRDRQTKGGNVIAGFFMEPALALSLTNYARAHFAKGATPETAVADLAAAARYLLRVQLRQTPAEDAGRSLSEATRGMRVDAALDKALKRYHASTGLSFNGAVRHLVRLGLGVSDEESVQREEHFATLADARRGLGLAGAAQFGGAKGK